MKKTLLNDCIYNTKLRLLNKWWVKWMGTSV